MSSFALERMQALPLSRWWPILRWWVASRLLALLAFLLVIALGPRGHFVAMRISSRPLAILSAWDGVWYERVAQHGYLIAPGMQSDPAFFPLYPIALKLCHAVSGLPYPAAGALLSNLSLAVAVVAFYELGVRVLGDHDLSRRAACFMAVTPMGFVFSMSYPEGLTLALISLALLAAFEYHWLAAAGLAAAAVLARPEAVFLAIPLGALAWARRSELDASARGRALAATLAAPAALVTYPLYLQWSLHDAGAWGQAEQRWGRAFVPTGPLRAASSLVDHFGSAPVLSRDAGFLVLYVALLVLAARRGVPPAWIVSGALVLALPLFSGSVESEGRFGLLALPVYWGAGTLAGRRVERALRIGSLVLLACGVLALPYLWP